MHDKDRCFYLFVSLVFKTGLCLQSLTSLINILSLKPVEDKDVKQNISGKNFKLGALFLIHALDCLAPVNILRYPRVFQSLKT